MVRLAVAAARQRARDDDEEDEEDVQNQVGGSSTGFFGAPSGSATPTASPTSPQFMYSRTQTVSLTRKTALGKCQRRLHKRYKRVTTRRPKYGEDSNLEPYSLRCFHIDGKLRQRCLAIVETPLFDGFILLLILLNSILLAAYHHRDNFNEPMSSPKCVKDPTTFGCGREPHPMNVIADTMDPVFLFLFVVEMGMKIIAYGFFGGRHTYLSDTWNWLDFVVVVTGILWWMMENLTVNSTITMLRVFRVLRPLRALTTMPEMKVLVNTVLQSIPKLGNVLSMTVFLLFIFGVLGLNLWQGIYERRCRTRGDVRWVTATQPGCTIGADEEGRWEWPLALDDDGEVVGRPCGGRYMCEDLIEHVYHGDKICGSLSIFDLEPDYQPNFPSVVTLQSSTTHTFDGDTSHDRKKAAAKFGKWCENSRLDVGHGYFYTKKNDANFGYGITNFNNILNAVIVIFQCITMEGWTDIMYMSQDAHSNDFAFVYFCFLVVIGSFFLLNVALAVVWDAFQELSKKYQAGTLEVGAEQVDDNPFGAMDEKAAGESESESTNEEKPVPLEPMARATGGANKIAPEQGAPPAEVVGGEAQQASSAPKEGEHSLIDAEGNVVMAQSPHQGGGNSPLHLDLNSTEAKQRQMRVRSASLLVYEDEVLWQPAFDFASTSFFQNFVMACIILNIIIMMMDAYPPVKPPLSGILDIMNTVFTIIFLIEMLIVLSAIGPIHYSRQFWHALDGIIVVFSVAELFSDGGGGALKSLRLLRIIKLAKKNENFRKLLQAVVQTVLSMGHFTLLLCLMIFVFALMGSIMFANKLKFHPVTDEPLPEDQPCPGGTSDWDYSCVRRSNFDTFLWAIVTVFQGLTGENWNALMYDGMRGAGFGYFLFHFAMVILGMCIIFNLFLAILMANFADAAEAVRAEEEQKKEMDEGDATSRINWAQALADLANDTVEGIEGGVVSEDAIARIDFHSRKAGNTIENYLDKEGLKKLQREKKALKKERGKQLYLTQTGLGGISAEDLVEREEKGESGGAPKDDASGEASAENASGSGADNAASGDLTGTNAGGSGSPSKPPNAPAGDHEPAEEQHTDTEATLKRMHVSRLRRGHVVIAEKDTKLVNSQDSAFVHFCIKICDHRRFDQFILVMIVLSSIGMAFDDPMTYPQAPATVTLTVVNLIFTFIFTSELFIKHVAMGVRRYWRNGWNILDGIVVFVSLLDAVYYFISLASTEESSTDVSWLKTVRMLRAFRPLRVISRNPNLKLVVNTIFASLPQLRTLAMLMMLFFLIIGLVAVNYLKGAFSGCDGFDVYPFRRALEEANTLATTAMCEYDCTATENCTQGARLIKKSGASCAAGQTEYQRQFVDHPVCLGGCSLEETGSGVCANFPALSRVTRMENGVRVSDLPNMCNKPSALSTMAAPQRAEQFPGGVVPPSWTSALEYNLMQCSKCKDRYCPDKDVSQQCVDFCRDPLLGQCQDSCGGHFPESSVQCQTCRAECQAGCACEDNCSAMTQDAALCVEQGASMSEQSYKWVPSISQSFDNIGRAVVTLLEISTTEGWVDVMLAAVDARGVDRQPLRDYNEIWSIFFVLFMLVGCFLILNLCVGVIVDNFAEMKKAQRNPAMSLLITPAQMKWINTQKSLNTRKIFLSLKHLDSYDQNRRRMFFLVNDDRFEGFIMFAIVANALIMASTFFPDDPAGGNFDFETYVLVLNIANYIFSLLFVFEAGMKLYAHRWFYFTDWWNRFDFALVCSTVIGAILELGTDVQLGVIFSIMRMFRVARLLRLLQFAKGLNKIFTAFLLSIPKLFNVACICFLLLFLFAVMGVQLFGKVQFGETHDDRGNFRTFYRACMTLVRALTGEAWNELMHDLGRGAFAFGRWDGKPCVADFDMANKGVYDMMEERCLLDHPIECGNGVMSHFFWISYTMMITFVVFNLVVAVILEGYEDSTQNTEDEIVNQAIDLWKKYDPKYRLRLTLEQVPDFVTDLRKLLSEPPDADEVPFEQLSKKEQEFLTVKGNEEREVDFLGAVQHVIRVVMFFQCADQEERVFLMRDLMIVEQSVLEPGHPGFHKHLRHAMTRGAFMPDENFGGTNGFSGGGPEAVIAALQRKSRTPSREVSKDKSDEQGGGVASDAVLGKADEGADHMEMEGAPAAGAAPSSIEAPREGSASGAGGEKQTAEAEGEAQGDGAGTGAEEGEHNQSAAFPLTDSESNGSCTDEGMPSARGAGQFLFYTEQESGSEEEEVEVEESETESSRRPSAPVFRNIFEGSHRATPPSSPALSRDLVELAGHYHNMNVHKAKMNIHKRLAPKGRVLNPTAFQRRTTPEPRPEENVKVYNASLQDPAEEESQMQRRRSVSRTSSLSADTFLGSRPLDPPEQRGEQTDDDISVASTESSERRMCYAPRGDRESRFVRIGCGSVRPGSQQGLAAGSTGEPAQAAGDEEVVPAGAARTGTGTTTAAATATGILAVPSPSVISDSPRSAVDFFARDLAVRRLPRLTARDFQTRYKLNFACIFAERERRQARRKLSLLALSRKSRERAGRAAEDGIWSTPSVSSDDEDFGERGGVKNSNQGLKRSSSSFSLFGLLGALNPGRLLGFGRGTGAAGVADGQNQSGQGRKKPLVRIKFVDPPKASPIGGAANSNTPQKGGAVARSKSEQDEESQAKLRALDSMFSGAK